MIFTAVIVFLSLRLCSTSITGSFTWHRLTTMTLWTLSAALAVRSVWLQWGWCSLMTCCRTWREANRLRSCGSGSLWKWPRSLPELLRGGPGQAPMPLLPPRRLHTHSTRGFCQGCWSLLILWVWTRQKHSTQAVQSVPCSPLPSHKDFLFSLLCLFRKSMEEKADHRLLPLGFDWLLVLLMYFCVTVEKKVFFHLPSAEVEVTTDISPSIIMSSFCVQFSFKETAESFFMLLHSRPPRWQVFWCLIHQKHVPMDLNFSGRVGGCLIWKNWVRVRIFQYFV